MEKIDKITAKEHRQRLQNNPNRFCQDKDRAINSWAEVAWAFVRQYSNTEFRKRDAIEILKSLAELVWDAQGGEPLFQFNSKSTGLPMSWNSPRHWSVDDYIHYEVGHMIARNGGGSSHPRNLCFQSARCNQHLQASLDIEEAMEYFETNKIVRERVAKLIELHKTDKWRTLIDKLDL